MRFSSNGKHPDEAAFCLLVACVGIRFSLVGRAGHRRGSRGRRRRREETGPHGSADPGVVAEAVCAIEIANAVAEKFGGDSVKELKRNFRGYLDQVRKF